MYEYIYEWDNACIKVFHGRCIAVGLLGRWVHFLIPQPASSALPISNEVRSIEVGRFFNHIMYVCAILYIMFYHYTVYSNNIQCMVYDMWYFIIMILPWWLYNNLLHRRIIVAPPTRTSRWQFLTQTSRPGQDTAGKREQTFFFSQNL